MSSCQAAEMQYTLAKEFLYKVYSPSEEKIVTHPQAHLILRVLGSTIGHSLNFQNIYAFINSHMALKSMFGECTEDGVQLQLDKLKSIGVVMEHKPFI